MARQRTIKPEFWWDEVVDELTNDEALAFIALWNIVDDEGRYKMSPKELEMKCPRTQFRGMWAGFIERFEELGLVVSYTVNKKEYFHVRTWYRHQLINRPTISNIPSPPSDPIREEVDRQKESVVNVDEGIPYEDIAKLHNTILGKWLPNVKFNSKDRVWLVVRSAWKSYSERQDVAWWKKYFNKVSRSKFLTGQKTNFSAPFRWLFISDNIDKVMGGQYDDPKDNRSSQPDATCTHCKQDIYKEGHKKDCPYRKGKGDGKNEAKR